MVDASHEKTVVEANKLKIKNVQPDLACDPIEV
jgi:hypothetical protein